MSAFRERASSLEPRASSLEHDYDHEYEYDYDYDYEYEFEYDCNHDLRLRLYNEHAPNHAGSIVDREVTP